VASSGPAPTGPGLSCAKGSGAGRWTPRGVSPEWSRGVSCCGCPSNHCLKPSSAGKKLYDGQVSGALRSVLSPRPVSLSPTFSLYPLVVSPCLQGFWEKNGPFSSSVLTSRHSPAVFPQNRLALSSLPTGKDCRPMPSPRSRDVLACCGSIPRWGMCWQLNSAEPWLLFG